MARTRTVHRCQQCGATAPKWQGRCPGCEEWNTLVEELEAPAAASGSGPWAGTAVEPPRLIAEVGTEASPTLPTGIDEVDRVLGGGLVPGSVTLVGGEPGIGKSTLLLQLAASVAATGRRVLYVTAEESATQVRSRAERLGAVVADLWLVAETSVPRVVAVIDEVDPEVVIVDSVQALVVPELGSAPGSVAQVRESAFRLVTEARARGTATVLVGHVTKDGALAGPRVLEHVVDTVVSFEGDRHGGLRLLRATKHRFGSTADVGVFEMGEAGLRAVADPSGMFLADRRPGVAGSVVAAVVEGRRPVLVEVQALVGRSNLPSPRRSAQGLDGGRLALLLAVLERRVGLEGLAGADVHTLAVGGVRLAEPGADLAVAMAVASAFLDVPVPAEVAVYGEVGLAGEVRRVGRGAERLAEAGRLGFTRVLGPAEVRSDAGHIGPGAGHNGAGHDGVDRDGPDRDGPGPARRTAAAPPVGRGLVRVATLAAALAEAGLFGTDGAPAKGRTAGRSGPGRA
jgi:DNA repair protein RadA/Sms